MPLWPFRNCTPGGGGGGAKTALNRPANAVVSCATLTAAITRRYPMERLNKSFGEVSALKKEKPTRQLVRIERWR